MTQRRYGPVKGAGTTVTELEGSKQIEAGALGFAGYAGIFEKGPVGELIIAKTKKEFNQKMGSYYADTLAPDAAEHFFELARGAGGLAMVRVTDGNEVAAQRTLFTRNGDLRESMGVLKAQNGGKWGGKALKYFGEMFSVAAGLTELTLTTQDETSFAKDQLKGGYIELENVADTQYIIASNTASATGSPCVITVLDGYTMLSDVGGGTSEQFYVVLENDAKEITFSIGDGEDKPDTEFSISAFVDGELARKWPNLHTDPLQANYWVSAINDDELNYYVTAVDGWDGKPHVPAARPADFYGVIPTSGVTATVLTSTIFDSVGNFADPTGEVTTLVVTTPDDLMLEQTLTCTFSAATTFDVVSDIYGSIAVDQTTAVQVAPFNKYAPLFTLTVGGTVAAGDEVVIHYKPFVKDELIGGFVYPDKVNAPSTKFRIIDNDFQTVTIATGYDLTDVAEDGDYFQIEKPLPMSGGRDGIADLVDADFVLQAWDVDNSPFNKTFGQNLGVIKFAAPGWDAFAGLTSAIDVAGLAYAEAKNHMYRVEVPISIVAEDLAIAHINSTIGRSDFLVASFPSWGYVLDPEAPGTNKLKQVPLTGMIHGREARIAEDWGGYHKAAAGLDAILPKVVKLTTGTAMLDEEKLNPAGLSVIKKLKGSFVIWGDRTCYDDPNWKWKHQRELMSYYEHVLQESFDWIIFAINDPATDSDAIVSLQGYFLPEWRKRAIRGDKFTDAATIKLDDENNTDATRADGDLNVEIRLQLADTVERFNIFIGKQGIFDSVG